MLSPRGYGEWGSDTYDWAAKMQELVGRLTALDAEATETLKVISYFDALIDGRAGVDVLLRGAAVLSGCAAGVRAEGRAFRVDASGTRSPAPKDRSEPLGEWPSLAFGDDGTAWIEREGAAHANDHMILERLAIGLALALDRTSPSAAARRAIETLISADATEGARNSAVKRLRLDTSIPYRVIASPASVGCTRPSLVMGTSVGAIRVSLHAETEPDTQAEVPERAGIGTMTMFDALDSSWASALVALRLTSAHTPTIEADDLGGLLVLASAAESAARPAPDAATVGAFLRSHPQDERLLDVIANHDSLRAVAAELGLHHSTVQRKASQIADVLGFDTRSPGGRVRLVLAIALHRLATARFD